MVAPNYAEKRRALAKEIGLGTKGGGGGRKPARRKA
jgi:predicted transcriptional regulator